jgi:hypothetical protein
MKKINNKIFYIILLVSSIIILILIYFKINVYKNIETLQENNNILPIIKSTDIKNFDVHPICNLSNINIKNFYNRVNLGNSGDPIIDEAYKSIIKSSLKDVKSKSNANVTLECRGYLTPHDLKRRNISKESYEKSNEKSNENKSSDKTISGCKNIGIDSKRCYRYALTYLITKDEEYAIKVIEIFDSWATTCKKLDGVNAPLESSWALTHFSNAEEIIKYTYNGWNKEIETKWHNWINNVIMKYLLNNGKFYQQDEKNKGLLNKNTDYNNWHFAINNSILIYSKVSNNYEQFIKSANAAITLYKDLFFNSSKKKYFTTGQAVETSRDINHSMMGLGSICNSCELLWHHGYDLYSLENNMLLKSYEFHAEILLQKRTKIENDEIYLYLSGNTNDTTRTFEEKANILAKIGCCQFDMVYNHYVNRKKLKMPNTNELLSRIGNRPDDIIFDSGLTTLTHYNLDSENKPTPTSSNGTTPRLTTPYGTTPRLTTPYGTTPRLTTPYGTTPRSTTPYGTTPRLTTPYGTTPRSTTPRKITPYGTTPRSTTPRKITPYGTTPRSTTPRSTTPRLTTPVSKVFKLIPFDIIDNKGTSITINGSTILKDNQYIIDQKKIGNKDIKLNLSNIPKNIQKMQNPPTNNNATIDIKNFINKYYILKKEVKNSKPEWNFYKKPPN